MFKNIIIIALGAAAIFFAATDGEYEQRFEDFVARGMAELG